jgi:LDH2 family malate/lactate/ureidoglycolate dehydrogenase
MNAPGVQHNALFLAIGSLGDVLPLANIAVSLSSPVCRVLFASHAHHQVKFYHKMQQIIHMATIEQFQSYIWSYIACVLGSSKPSWH